MLTFAGSLTPLAFWTPAEEFLGVTCPCLLTLRPVVQLAWQKLTGKSISHTKRPEDQEHAIIRKQLSNGSMLKKPADSVPPTAHLPENDVYENSDGPGYERSELGRQTAATMARDEEKGFPLPET